MHFIELTFPMHIIDHCLMNPIVFSVCEMYNLYYMYTQSTKYNENICSDFGKFIMNTEVLFFFFYIN